MARSSDDELDRLLGAWRAGACSEDLFLALRDPMRQAARRGIRRISGRQPDEADVDDVVLRAFRELLERDAAATSTIGLASVIAERRGMDKARALIRDRKQIERVQAELAQLNVDPEDAVAAARR